MNCVFFIADEKLNDDILDYEDLGLFHRMDVLRFVEQDRLASSKSIAHGLVPSPFVAGIILAESSKHLYEAVLSRGKEFFPWFDSDMVRIVSQIDLEALAWVVRSTAIMSQRIANQATRADQENAEIRVLYERAQSALFEIENFRGKSYGPRILLQVLPSKGESKISSLPISWKIKQEYKSIHAVDLFFDRKESIVSNADIVVAMKGSESGLELAAWHVPEVRLRPGWNRFYCPVFDEPIGESITLSVAATNAATHFILQNGERYEDSSPVSVTPEEQDPVAFRLWSGLPGIKLPRTEPGHAVDDQDLTDPKALSRVELLQLGSAVERDQMGLVSWQGESDALMVHPNGPEPVVARIAMLNVTNLSAITVTCKLNHPEARTTDFGAWIVRPNDTISGKSPVSPRTGSSVSRLFGARRPGGRASAAAIPANVEWLTLTGGQEGEISFAVDPAYTGTVDLFFATRNYSKSNHNSWALFTDVRFEISTPRVGAAHAAR